MLELENPIQEDCGIAGVFAPKGEDAVPLAAIIGSELQHRGQEGAGIGVKPYDLPFHVVRSSARFGITFGDPKNLHLLGLKGESALVHTRYRTAGPADDVDYAHPFEIHTSRGNIIGVVNGNLVNSEELYEDLKSKGVKLQTENKTTKDGKPLLPSDSEILLARIAHAPGVTWQDRIARGMEGVQGATSAVITTEDDQMIAWKDPNGIRPLVYGRLGGNFWTVSSESTPLDEMGVEYFGSLKKGQMITFDQQRAPEIFTYDNSQQSQICTFEDWYFSWPASRRNGVTMAQVREMAGEILAEEEILSGRFINADLVTGIPDTGRSGGQPFAEYLKLPYRDRIYKKRYDDKGGRGFLGSTEENRSFMMERKYSPDYSVRDKVLYFVDDSLVRGETTKILTETLKKYYGVKEIHYRFFSPKIIRPCYLGVNINSREELGAVKQIGENWYIKSNREIADMIGADSVAFLSIDGVRKLRDRLGERVEDFCSYCHGEPGPQNIDWTKFDPQIMNERYNRDRVLAHS